MSKIIDITNKLNFAERPQLKIKDVSITVNDDVVSMLKVTAIFSEDKDISTKVVFDLYNLLFDKSEQKKIEKLKLNTKDFTILVGEAASLIMSASDNDMGEAQTPATT